MTTCQNDESLFKGPGKVDVTCVGSQRPTNEKSTSSACATQTSSGKQPFIMSQDNDNIPHPVRVPLASFFSTILKHADDSTKLRGDKKSCKHRVKYISFLEIDKSF